MPTGLLFLNSVFQNIYDAVTKWYRSSCSVTLLRNKEHRKKRNITITQTPYLSVVIKILQ